MLIIELMAKRKVFIGIGILLLAASLWLWLGSSSSQNVTIEKKSEDSVVLAVLGDSGTGSKEQRQIAKLINQQPFDAVLHTGDIAYPDGTVKQFEDFYTSIYSKHIRDRLYPSIGNHEYNTSGAQAYIDLFKLPRQALAAADQEHYYSFNVKNVHIVSLDTNRPLDNSSADRGDDMVDWLEQDLVKVKPGVVKVVFFHHPPFSDGEHGSDLRVQQKLVPVFDKHGVDLVISGHDHIYQRTCPIIFTIDKDGCQAQGTVYAVTGGGGADLYGFKQSSWFNAARASKYHFVLLQITPSQIELKAIDNHGKVFDTATIAL